MKLASAAISLFLLLATGKASAATPSCAIQGVWRGHLGEMPITVEIASEYGRYRYREALNDLLLKPRQGANNTWEEYDSKGKQTGSLQLACNGDTASGSWISPAGRSAPIAVQRSPSYDGDRIKNAPLQVLSQKTLSGRAVQLVSIRGVRALQTLQIVNPSPSETKVNQALREELNRAVENHLDCVIAGYAVERFADPFGDTLNLLPVIWSGALLSVVRDYGGYCGGAHPYHDFSYSVFDTKKGIKIPIENWIVDEQKDKSDVPYTSALGQVIWSIALRGKPNVKSLLADDQQCLGTLNEPAATIAGIDANGMKFRYWYPYAQSGCVEDYAVPWKKLKQFLSHEGRQYVDELQRNP